MDLPLSKKTVYRQSYKKEWEIDNKWLKPVIGDASKAMCTYCKTEINAKFYDVQRHKETKKHIAKSLPFASLNQTKIVVTKKDDISACRSESFLSMYIAEHCAINNVDQLTMRQ